MGEKAKTAIIDLMKSDEMRAYFNSLPWNLIQAYDGMRIE